MPFRKKIITVVFLAVSFSCLSTVLVYSVVENKTSVAVTKSCSLYAGGPQPVHTNDLAPIANKRSEVTESETKDNKTDTSSENPTPASGKIQELQFESHVITVPVKEPSLTHVTGDFYFKNLGKEPVRIELAKTNCDCLTIKDYPKEIAAGERKKVQVSLDIRGIQGKNSYYTFLKTQRGNVYKLKLTAKIPQYVTLTPSSVSWLVGKPAKKMTLKAKASGNYNVPITKLVCTEPDVNVKLECIKEGREYLIHLIPPERIYRTFIGNLTVKTDFPKDSKIPLSIGVNVTCTQSGVFDHFMTKQKELEDKKK